MNHKIDRDTYIIPPNFIESGTFFGGMFKARNVIEAGILAFAIGVPVFSLLPLGLTARIIALCLTALPAALVALIGVSGESLSSFLLIFIKYLRNRRIVGGNSAEDAVPAAEHGGKHIKKKAHKPDRAPRRSRRSGREDFPAEFDEVRSYEIRQKLRPVKKQKPAKEKKAAKQKKKVSKERKVKRPIRTQDPKPAYLNPVADYLPISKIENGIIYTKDHRYVKVVEVVPINFMLRSAQEQRNIIYSFVSYLKISPIKLQIKVLTRRAEINRHLNTVRKEMEQETNEQCLLMQEDYLQFVQQIGSREAITRRFFLIFECEPWSNTKRSDEEGEAINALQSAVHTATNYLRQCGNEVIVPENWDEFTVDVLYNLLCRNESAVKPLSIRAQEVVAEYLAKGRDSEIDHIPATEFCAPKSIDFTHGHHICIDGLYYAYLLVPSDGYKTQVPAGWLSLTAEFISARTGLASVAVSSKSKQLGTWRISNYTPEFRETSGVGKRPVLTPDEVLRLPLDQALIIIRGKKVLQVDKMDYSKHPEAKYLRSCKASAHVPEWRRLEEEAAKTPQPAPKPAPAAKKPAKRKATKPASPTDKSPKEAPAPKSAGTPEGIITTDKDSILS